MKFILKLLIFIITLFLGIFIFGVVLITKFLNFFFQLITGNVETKNNDQTHERNYNRTHTSNKKSGRFGDNFYYTYTNSGNAEDIFSEFFKQQSRTNYSYDNRHNNNYSYNNNRSRNNPFEYYNEDFSKYYNVLGVNSEASKEEIRKAYLIKVKEHHPDRFANSPQNLQSQHENKLKDINEAYNKVMNKFS